MLDKELYEFGPFRLNVEDRRLLRDGEPVHLEPKVFEVLVVLVRNQGQLLTKEQLKKEIDVNSEAVLARHVSVLRKTLGDGLLEQRKYIKTAWKSGYRFVASAQRIALGEGNADNPQNRVEASELPSTAPLLRTHSWPHKKWVIVVVVLFFSAGIGFWYRREVEADVRRVVQDSQVIETLQIYTNPDGFDMTVLRKYWLSEEEGGIEIINVKNTIEKLRCEGTRYGADSKLEWFKFRGVQISAFGFGSTAIAETDEYWYLPKYKKDGGRAPQEEKNIFMRTSPKYELKKKNGSWLIVRSGVPRKATPCPTPSPK